METLSFAFGMLAIIAIILIVIVIIGIVKVYKQQSEIKDTRDYISNLEQSVHLSLNELDRNMSQRIDNLNSYTDSRFDKLQSKLTQQGSKELLKG
jgi:predicted PurR-regulated permease PerM